MQAANIAIVNQEVIIGGEELGVSGYPSFNAPYEVADALAETGFDVILHGTNHAMDQGKKGITNCLSNWEKKYPDIKILGINKSQDAQDSITVLEQNGIKIAVLNYTYGLNGIALPSDMPYAVNLLDEEKVKADIASAKEQSDFVIVCPHWGTEYSLQPDSMQKKWTKIFAESGADLVLGTHPHVIEPIEWVEDETTGHQMLVYYSLGNFVNWTSSSGDGIANRMVGGMAEITVGFDEAGKGFIVDYGVNALVTQVEQGHGGVTTYFLRDYTDEMAGKNAIIEQDANFSREYCTKLCTDIWGRFVGVILEGKQIYKNLFTHRYEEKRNGFHISVDFFLTNWSNDCRLKTTSLQALDRGGNNGGIKIRGSRIAVCGNHMEQ